MTGGGGYDGHATERFANEAVKRAHSQDRSPFQRDRARVLHSSALRRLAAKTQVVEVGQADFPRTRLTHSLECAQIGRELGAALGCDPDLVDAACLAHDLGHPPFGHNGESALAQVAAACGGFEGNAQSLRLLTRLEPKVPGAGLNLTRATLDATLKYPWLASQAASTGAGPEPPAGAKYGCYDEDADVFAWIRLGAPGSRPCLEAQVMDWADDVAYSVHDLEDGLHSGLIVLDRLRDHGERRRVAALTQAEYCAPGSVTVEELGEIFDGLLRLSFWPQRFDAEPQTVAAVKNLTSELIGRFCDAALAGTRQADSAPLSRYAADLVVPREQRLECALLKGVTAYYVMGRTGAVASQARERQVLTELAAALSGGAPGALDPMFRADYESAGSDPARLRVIVDQVASLTDTSATAWHAKLCQ
ncbi:MAG TPA: deoxyguanosinetriphosphate triphosphohydrolase [Streptosporangiaceae bacterium]|nr:deoxyguanosinetriphosphate triphosphohydrolase [Streptosporangiaceae bacterium]